MSKFQDNLARLGFKNYEEYLLSPHWTTFKAKYQKSDRPLVCAVCRHPAIQLHHHNYDRLGCEQFDDVTPLCWRHHDEVHKWLETSGKTFVRYTSEAVAFLRGKLPPPKPISRKHRGKKRQKRVLCPKPSLVKPRVKHKKVNKPKSLCKGCGRQRARKNCYYCTPCLLLALPKNSPQWR